MNTIDVPYSKSEVHRDIAFAWRAQQAGRIDELNDEFRILAVVLAEHPEWVHLWEATVNDTVGDSIVTSEGVDPFMRVTTEAAGELMIQVHPNGRLAYQHLRSEGWTHKAARAEIIEAQLGVFLAVHMPDFNGKRVTDLDAVFKRIRSGESTEDIFAIEE